ncbi:MAG: hypothetical protein HC896_05235 [Bacteroidales bacterium]|nr:hypothetical protein [Bacteroidales bacterium]
MFPFKNKILILLAIAAVVYAVSSCVKDKEPIFIDPNANNGQNNRPDSCLCDTTPYRNCGCDTLDPVYNCPCDVSPYQDCLCDTLDPFYYCPCDTTPYKDCVCDSSSLHCPCNLFACDEPTCPCDSLDPVCPCDTTPYRDCGAILPPRHRLHMRQIAHERKRLRLRLNGTALYLRQQRF